MQRKHIKLYFRGTSRPEVFPIGESSREIEREPQEIRQQSKRNIQEVEILGAFLESGDDSGTVYRVVQIPTEDMLLLWFERGGTLCRTGQVQQQNTSDDHRQTRFNETLRNWEHSPLLFAVQPYQGRLFYSIGNGRDWQKIYSTEVEKICNPTLSSILEEQVDQKYFLSKEAVKRLWNNGEGFHSKLHQQYSPRNTK